MIKNAILLSCMFLCMFSLCAQTDTVITFKLPALKISQMENGKNVIYEFDDSPNEFSIKDSSLIANPKKYEYSVNIADVNKITIVRSSKIGPVIAISFCVGFLFGAVLSGVDVGGGHSVSTGERILNGFIVGGLLGFLGGSIALLIAHDKEYDISKNKLSEKKKVLIKALKENKIE